MGTALPCHCDAPKTVTPPGFTLVGVSVLTGAQVDVSLEVVAVIMAERRSCARRMSHQDHSSHAKALASS